MWRIFFDELEDGSRRITGVINLAEAPQTPPSSAGNQPGSEALVRQRDRRDKAIRESVG